MILLLTDILEEGSWYKFIYTFLISSLALDSNDSNTRYKCIQIYIQIYISVSLAFLIQLENDTCPSMELIVFVTISNCIEDRWQLVE